MCIPEPKIKVKKKKYRLATSLKKAKAKMFKTGIQYIYEKLICNKDESKKFSLFNAGLINSLEKLNFKIYFR